MSPRPESILPKPEKAILVGVYQSRGERAREEESLRELEELARSAGAEIVGCFLQEKQQLDSAFLIGRGKAEEIRGFVWSYQADLVIFDAELSPAQSRNLEKVFEIKVLDRSELILDIFAQRARSSEGKLQVELAQLDYLLPRLVGRGAALSRLGGGIGTRGPGETKLETDRRLIRRKMARIRKDLTKLEERRSLHRRKRQGKPIPTVSLVGYTNAGKSTLFNRLTSESTYADDRMFATLDPLVRRLELPSGQETLLADTVGFIRKLPHALVAAFHATLEETLEADLIVHVVDVSQPAFTELRQAVYRVLLDIGLSDKPILEVYNKTDLVGSMPVIESEYPFCLVSAVSGEGIEQLLDRLEMILGREFRPVRLRIPFERAELIARLRETSRIESEEYRADGIYLLVALSPADRGRFREYFVAA